MKVLYLDFDGVLHHENVVRNPRRGIVLVEPGHTLFEWGAILEDLLLPHPEVAIVLSTSWVFWRSFHFASAHLSKPLQERVIGATYHRRHHDRVEFWARSRGQQIATDAMRRNPQSWFALDDDDQRWPAWCRDHLIVTNGEFGLSEAATQHAVKLMLERF